MDYEEFGDTAEAAGELGEVWVADDCPGGNGEAVRLRALKLYVLSTTAQKHGGTVEYDLASDSVEISVPKEEISACTEEVAKQLGAAYRFFQCQRSCSSQQFFADR
jgi:hypothetical protein